MWPQTQTKPSVREPSELVDRILRAHKVGESLEIQHPARAGAACGGGNRDTRDSVWIDDYLIRNIHTGIVVRPDVWGRLLKAL